MTPCITYVKGGEKTQFLEDEGFEVRNLDFVPSFKTLNECTTDWCEIKHGKSCARRKVHELKRYIDSNGIVLKGSAPSNLKFMSSEPHKSLVQIIDICFDQSYQI